MAKHQVEEARRKFCSTSKEKQEEEEESYTQAKLSATVALTWGPPLQPGAVAAPVPPQERLGTALEKQQTNSVISLQNTQKTSAGDRGQSGRDLGEELHHVLLGPDDRRDQTVRPVGLGGTRGMGGCQRQPKDRRRQSETAAGDRWTYLQQILSVVLRCVCESPQQHLLHH